MSETLASTSSTIPSPHLDTSVDFEENIKTIVSKSLGPLVQKIDKEGFYPEQVLKSLGSAGAYAQHLPGFSAPDINLKKAITATQIAGEKCMSTAFCMWCHNALAWYIFNSDNEELKSRLGPSVARGEVLGGTGLSNPMKTFFGIEEIRLKGKKVPGGYMVKGSLPWVSNLGDDHYFGGIFELEDKPGHFVMAVFDCSEENLSMSDNTKFVALDGTRTYALQMRNLFIPDALILADPITDYLKKIRSGFVLLQAGMAFGVIQSSINLMKRMARPLGHVNRYLDEQPEDFEERLSALQDKASVLAETPYDPSPEYWRSVIEARLEAGEMSVQAAHAAMLHCGARGYVQGGEAQRRLRESYFVAIVTPATKQLRKMLSDMAH